ncbi:unnamed protein product, partial [marine sediment metagenome]
EWLVKLVPGHDLLISPIKRKWIAAKGYEACQPYDAPQIAKKWDKFLRRL